MVSERRRPPSTHGKPTPAANTSNPARTSKPFLTCSQTLVLGVAKKLESVRIPKHPVFRRIVAVSSRSQLPALTASVMALPHTGNVGRRYALDAANTRSFRKWPHGTGWLVLPWMFPSHGSGFSNPIYQWNLENDGQADSQSTINPYS